MRKSSSGFTIIEILVVVAVIAILATISVVSFSRYQIDSRDTQRESRATIIAEALEKYYDENGEYPSCGAVTADAATVTTTVLQGVDPLVLLTPRSPMGDTNSIDICTALDPNVNPDSFAYVGDGSTACISGQSCLQFSLQYVEERTGQVKTIESRRTTDIATSGAIDNLTATAFAFQQINLTWTAVENATIYAIQRSGSSDFAANTPLPSTISTSASSTGLTPGTTYYYRVAPVTSGGDVGAWSNTASATTPELTTPSCTVTPNGPFQIDVTWTNVSLATSYTLQHANDAGFSSGVITAASLSTSPRTYSITGLTPGMTKYIRVQAVATGDVSEYCPYQSATTTVPTPTGLTATTNSATQITASWNSVPVATSYRLEYSLSSSFSSVTEVSGITTTNQAVTGLSQGRTYYFRVIALVGSVESTASSSANATTTVNTPSTPSVGVAIGGIRAYSAGRWIYFDGSPQSGNWYYAQGWASTSCGGGTTAQYLMGANYNSPSTFRGWTGWDSNSNYFMIRPYSGYTIRFTSIARCVSSQGVVSGNSGQGYSGYAGP